MGETAPWSEDKTFQETYFCNVHREDDKVTKWIRNRYMSVVNDRDYLAQYPIHPMPEFNMVVARLVNKPESLEAMGWPFLQWGRAEKKLFAHVMSQHGSWGSAYIVSTNGRSIAKWKHVLELLTKAQPQLEALPYTGTLANAHVLLTGIYGLASFMGAQIVADLKNTKGHVLADAPDWWSWCAHGPGSLRGMAWVLGIDKCNPATFYEEMPELYHAVCQALYQPESPNAVPTMCMQDLQNCLCEFDKYMRVSTGSGRSKRKYNGK